MEKPKINLLEKNETIDTTLNIEYSKNFDADRIGQTINKSEWYIKEGYWKNINLPEKIKKAYKNKEKIPDEQISTIVEAEYDEKKYQEKMTEIKSGWDKGKKNFLEKLTTLGVPIPSSYNLYLTKYGVGGSYEKPNNVVINYVNKHVKNNLPTLFHEIIHLAIEDLLEKYNLNEDHWLKERLVNLTQDKFYAEQNWRQPNPANAAKIEEIFNQYFPDIEKIIFEVSKIK